MKLLIKSGHNSIIFLWTIVLDFKKMWIKSWFDHNSSWNLSVSWFNSLSLVYIHVFISPFWNDAFPRRLKCSLVLFLIYFSVALNLNFYDFGFLAYIKQNCNLHCVSDNWYFDFEQYLKRCCYTLQSHLNNWMCTKMNINFSS